MRDVSSGKTFETAARIGLDGEARIVSIGDMTGTEARVIHPFDHPRVVIADFMVASKLLQYGMQQLSRMKWISPAPILIIQPDMELEGGLSELETRALLELGESAGARKSVAHYGGVLSDEDVVKLADVR
jgi:rod shape-determining protein MreB